MINLMNIWGGDYEYPVEIRVITERPFFHFKTNRKELTAEIVKEMK